MRISDWSSDVCSSDLDQRDRRNHVTFQLDRHGYAHQALYDFLLIQCITVSPDAVELRGKRLRRRQRVRREGNEGSGRKVIIELGLGQLSKKCFRPEERRVGKECASKCRFRRSTVQQKKK